MLKLTAARVIRCRSCRMLFHGLLPSQFDAHVRVISSDLRPSLAYCRCPCRGSLSTRLTAVTLTTTLDAAAGFGSVVAFVAAAVAVADCWQLRRLRRLPRLCLVA